MSYSSKISLSTILMGFILLLSGCSNDLEDLISPENNTTPSAVISRKVSKGDALVIAEKVLKKNRTREAIFNLPTFEYVIGGKNTRSSSANDTLAYVLNYPDNAGFVIVSADRKVYPVLAFSDEGNFSFDNEIAKANFIDRIGAYIETAESDSTLYDVSDDDFDSCYATNPMINISLGQESPWDKYVIQEHPDCLIGCVAVATALVMSHSKNQMYYHNSIVHLKSIITAIEKGRPDISVVGPKQIPESNTSNQPVYFYEQAVDSMAKLLYLIGKDVHMNYGPEGSWASSWAAYNLLKSLNFSIPTGFVDFDIDQVALYLKDNHIIYLRGSAPDAGGHAWVSDGCHYCVDPNDPSILLDTYIHCDWGWDGYCNGYYSGSVFEVDRFNFTPDSYFPVKREL